MQVDVLSIDEWNSDSIYGNYPIKQIFVNKKQSIEGTEQILVPSLEALECEERNGLDGA